MPTIDTLEQARSYLRDAIQVYDQQIMQVDAQFAAAEVLAKIAIAERMDTQNQSLELIASRIDDITTLLLNAEGAGGAIKVTQ